MDSTSRPSKSISESWFSLKYRGRRESVNPEQDFSPVQNTSIPPIPRPYHKISSFYFKILVFSLEETLLNVTLSNCLWPSHVSLGKWLGVSWTAKLFHSLGTVPSCQILPHSYNSPSISFTSHQGLGHLLYIYSISEPMFPKPNYAFDMFPKLMPFCHCPQLLSLRAILPSLLPCRLFLDIASLPTSCRMWSNNLRVRYLERQLNF